MSVPPPTMVHRGRYELARQRSERRRGGLAARQQSRLAAAARRPRAARAQFPAPGLRHRERQVDPGGRAGEPPGRRAVRAQRARRAERAEEVPQGRQGLPGRLGCAGGRLAPQVLSGGHRRTPRRRDARRREGAAVDRQPQRTRVRRHGVSADAGGQPDRFYLTSDKPLSVAGDFADFGSDMTALRRRLRAGGAQIYDSFTDYGKDFRRRLGIESEQAMELFHQTVSMKSVGNLTDFVRDHMLEPFDAARATADIVTHFEDLTKAHEAVRRAEAQLARLAPLLEDCDRHDAVRAEIAALDAQRAALTYYFADLKAGLVDAELAGISAQRARLQARRADLEAALVSLRDRETGLRVELAGHGGNRLAEIERQLAECDQACRSRMDKAERFAALLAAAGLDPVETAEQFAT